MRFYKIFRLLLGVSKVNANNYEKEMGEVPKSGARMFVKLHSGPREHTVGLKMKSQAHTRSTFLDIFSLLLGGGVTVLKEVTNVLWKLKRMS